MKADLHVVALVLESRLTMRAGPGEQRLLQGLQTGRGTDVSSSSGGEDSEQDWAALCRFQGAKVMS